MPNLSVFLLGSLAIKGYAIHQSSTESLPNPNRWQRTLRVAVISQKSRLLGRDLRVRLGIGDSKYGCSKVCGMNEKAIGCLLLFLLSMTGCQIGSRGMTHQVSKPPVPVWNLSAIRHSELIELENENHFGELIHRSGGPVLVDFYADWCQPCGRQSQVLSQVAKTCEPSQATIVKVNVERYPELVRQFQVEGLPTLMVFQHGVPVSRKTGFANEGEVANLLGLSGP